ncbi:MAG: ABC transporter substrate-binding protein [Candidatus Dormibacteraeota bacterium]|nr:ABC transporter substrate-binding protein [Candidatus Dormibacteraeota bacterium]
MRRLALLVLILLLVAACGGTSAGTSSTPAPNGKPEKATVEMAVGGVSQFIYLPLTLAEQLGYYREEGLTVHVTDFKGGSQAAQALVAGQADVTTGFYEHTIRFQVQQKQLTMFTLFDLYPGLVLLVTRAHASEVHSMKDLKGHSVGVTAKGSSTDEMVKILAKKAGLSPEDIPVRNIGTGGDALAAFKNPGDMWAGVTVDPAATLMVNQNLGTVLFDTRTAQQTKDIFGGAWPAGGFYAQTEFIKSNPNTVAALTRAGVRTLKFIKSHSAEEIAAKMPQDFYGGDRTTYVAALKASLPMFSPDGVMPADGPKDVLATLTLVDPNITADKVDLKKTFDNSPAQKVK